MGPLSFPRRNWWIAPAVEAAAMDAREVIHLKPMVSLNSLVASRQRAHTGTPHEMAIASSLGQELPLKCQITRVLDVAVSTACKTTLVPQVPCPFVWMPIPGTATAV